MSLSLRMTKGALSSGRSFSTVAPKIAIAQNIMRLKAISEATTEEALKAAMAAPAATIDANKLPEALADYGPMLSLGSMKAGDKFIPDPTAWQNMSWGDLAVHEMKRAETWPFVFGFGFCFLGLVAFQAGLSKDDAKHSKYIQMKEGTAHAH